MHVAGDAIAAQIAALCVSALASGTMFLRWLPVMVSSLPVRFVMLPVMVLSMPVWSVMLPVMV